MDISIIYVKLFRVPCVYPVHSRYNEDTGGPKYSD